MHRHFVKMTVIDQKDKRELYLASPASGTNWKKAGQSLSL